ncbi:glycoside hydrolase family 15 protein [Aquabacterium sp. J223]|uniref:glycoside hydrolase family 15 protein n=1 Tax=Aquabacterium sp. J223 TaxID=2898431 RepID=UPI0021AE2F98|nr:glycoside hydrolase family 15 protein [Aquabacterium sp. J223]UUX94115.1 glycoside hydrolase family 15 protein [Aquabacterium sp. J223]
MELNRAAPPAAHGSRFHPGPPAGPASLDLAVIGNCSYSALVDRRGRIVWCCLPRFDGDPVFDALLDDGPDGSQWTIELEDFDHSEQAYDVNTAIVRTRLHDRHGQSLEIVDFAPRFRQYERMFRPQTLVRRLRPLRGTPRIRVRLEPRFDWGRLAPTITRGSHHARYVGPTTTLRLTTNAPLDHVLQQQPFVLQGPMDFLLGPDETLPGAVTPTADQFERDTAGWWRAWTRALAVPLEWQEAVIRAAITLKLSLYEDTGAIVAAMTTSIPEAPGSGRTWDYRYCWLRDAFFTVRALNSLAEVATMEDHLRWLINVVASERDGHIQPLYGVGLEERLDERLAEHLPGYRGDGPVRIGNQAYEHFQHDVYGNIVLGAAQAFHDTRLLRPAGLAEFERLETVGRQALKVCEQPDAGMWELRTRARVHTTSALMSWAAFDRLAKIARRLALPDRERHWRENADRLRASILERSWCEQRRVFAESYGGRDLDAGVLLMAEVGFLPVDDPRFVSTVAALEQHLCDGPYMKRYEAPDDFGRPTTAFNICSFWRLETLWRLGRQDEAREIFEALLATRNHVGLLSEDTDPRTGELWGNFPQTYSMVGLINGAVRLSARWESVI